MLIESQLKRLGFTTASLFLLIVAVLINVDQMYLMTAIVVLVPFVAYLVNRFFSSGVTVLRTAPSTANQRSRHPVDLIVRNDSRIPKFYLRLNDSLPRAVYYGGTQVGAPSFIPVLWPGEEAHVRYYIEPKTRGLHQIGPLNVISTDVLGFTSIEKTVAGTSEVLVYPEVLPVAPVLMSTGAAVGLRDNEDARSKGSGTDFNGVREYQSGDELRRINWKSTARTGQLVVTEFSQGFASDVTIVLDRNRKAYENSGIGEINAFEYAVKIAVAFGVTALGRGSRVSLAGCGSDDPNSTVGRLLTGKGGVRELLEIMARVDSNVDDTLEDVIEARAWDDSRSSGVVVITPRSDDDSALRSILMESFGKNRMGGLQVFWLEASAFVDMERQMSSGAVTRSAYVPSAHGIALVSSLGREFKVGPDTNMVALLGGLAHGS